VVAVLIAFTFGNPAFGQIASKTGGIFGKVTDDQKNPLPGVVVTLESTLIPSQTATTGSTGGFRFANLPPGTYALNFSLEGFTEVRQEDVRVTVGSTVELITTLKPSLSEEFTVIGETPVVDSSKVGNDSTFGREFLEQVPNARDPWVILDQTPGIDNDRYNVAGSESGQQTGFFARGASDSNNAYKIDGIDETDPIAIGASAQYFDFDSFEEIQVLSGGSDASIQTNGVVLNIVSKRGGNQWAGNVSGYFVNDSLQADNTPEEITAVNGAIRSNRINEVWEAGFDVGGPLIKDKLFVWGAYRKQQINLFTRTLDPSTGMSLADDTSLKTLNFKTNFNWNASNETQFSFVKNDKDKVGRTFAPGFQAPETLWTQGSAPDYNGPQAIIGGQHTWIPNDKTIVTGRYGWVGLGFSLIPNGGGDIPMIYQYAISLYTNTAFVYFPKRPASDYVVDVNYYKENMMGGDHEFKFGFEYKSAKGNTFSSYGNGLYIFDYYATTQATQPGFALTSGFIKAQHYINGEVESKRTSLYATDTYRRDRLTLNLGVRIDLQHGKNLPSTLPGIPGFESLVGALEYPGSDLSPSFNNVSPRVGATYDLTGDGKTIIRGSFARYYDGWNGFYDQYSNPTYVYNGIRADYDVTGQGKTDLTAGDVTNIQGYGGWDPNTGFNLAAFEAQKLYDPDLGNQHSNEFIAGFEREVFKDASFAVNYTYRKYDAFICDCPFGITADSYVNNGDQYTKVTPIGTFNIPYSVLAQQQSGIHNLENIDDYTNTYNGVDFIFRKRMSNNFLMNSSLTLQRQKQNVGGGTAFFGAVTGDGFTGRVVEPDPSQVPLYDGQPYAYVSGGSGKTGVYPYSEWTFRLSGVYQFGWGISAGGFARYQQGFPYVIFASIGDDSFGPFDAAVRNLLAEPIGDRRYENIFTLDLNFQKVFDMGNAGRVTFAMDLFNVTNANNVIQRNRLLNSGTFNAIVENLSPRALRFGLRYSF
jgi:hypothetical protein